MEILIEINDSCIDEPSSLDFNYEEMVELGSTTTSTSKSIKFLPNEYFNQGENDDTKMGCTRYSPVNIVNAQNAYLMDEVPGINIPVVNPRAIWQEAYYKTPAIKLKGDSIQNGLQQLVKKKLISGFSRLATIELMKHSLDNCRLIATGSNSGDWDNVRENKVYRVRTDGKVVGHAFCIVGYNDEGFIGLNSYGKGNGEFLIPYELVGKLYSCYSVFDSTDEELINNYKSNIMDKITIEDAVKALENGIWNGERASAPASREEVAAMIQRALQALKK